MTEFISVALTHLRNLGMIYGMINPFIVIAVFPPSVSIFSMSTEDKNLGKVKGYIFRKSQWLLDAKIKCPDAEKIQRLRGFVGSEHSVACVPHKTVGRQLTVLFLAWCRMMLVSLRVRHIIGKLPCNHQWLVILVTFVAALFQRNPVLWAELA